MTLCAITTMCVATGMVVIASMFTTGVPPPGAAREPPPTTFSPAGVFTAGMHVFALANMCYLYCKPLHCISLYNIFIIFSETHFDAARQPPPMRHKTCSPESITTGMCHDVIVYNVMTQHCTSCVTVVQYTCMYMRI